MDAYPNVSKYFSACRNLLCLYRKLPCGQIWHPTKSNSTPHNEVCRWSHTYVRYKICNIHIQHPPMALSNKIMANTNRLSSTTESLCDWTGLSIKLLIGLLMDSSGSLKDHYLRDIDLQPNPLPFTVRTNTIPCKRMPCSVRLKAISLGHRHHQTSQDIPQKNKTGRNRFVLIETIAKDTTMGWIVQRVEGEGARQRTLQ